MSPAARPLILHPDSFPRDGLLDTAVSSTILGQVSRREVGETVRLHRTGPILAFGKLDRLRPGYGEAVAAARAHGYEPVERIAGGRAAVFHEGTISFSQSLPLGQGAYQGTRDRFASMAELIRDALTEFGIDAHLGEVPGEYCPGEFSVNAGGRLKLAGIGQRVRSGGAHLGAVIVVRGGDRIREVLEPVYEALELEWDPASCGSVALTRGEEDATRPFDAPDPLIDALLATIKGRLGAESVPTETSLPESTLKLAASIRGDFAPRIRPLGSARQT